MGVGSNEPIKGGKSGSKARNGSKSAPIPTNYQFVQYTPNESDKRAIKSANIDPVKALAGLFALLEDGYKCSQSFDEKNKCFVASITCNNDASPNYHRILTGRGNTPETAIVWLYWLHCIRFETVWVIEESSSWDY